MEDKQIVDLYWSRSPQAIAETQVKYGNYCFSIARNILPCREDAQECVSDTYFAAWNSIPPSRPSILSTFLGKLTRRISIDRWRRSHAAKRGGGNVDAALEELAFCIPGGTDPAAQVEAWELAQAVDAFLAQLPERERQIFLLRYFDLAPVQDICTRLQMRPGTVKSALHRTRKQLRLHLEKEGY